MLALAVGAIVALRLLNPVLGIWSIATGLSGLALAAGMWALSARRARQSAHALHAAAPVPGAGLLLLLALTAATAGALGLLYAALS